MADNLKRPASRGVRASLSIQHHRPSSFNKIQSPLPPIYYNDFVYRPPEVLLIKGMRNKVLVSVAQRLLPVAFLLVIHILVVLGDVGENHLVIYHWNKCHRIKLWILDRNTSTSSMLAHWVRMLCMKMPRSAWMFA